MLRSLLGGLVRTGAHESRVKRAAEHAFREDETELEVVESVRIHRRGINAYTVVIRAREDVPPARIPPDTWVAYYVSRFTLSTRRIEDPYTELSGPVQLP